MRKFLLSGGVVAVALTFAVGALTAPSTGDLLKDEQHFYDQSQKTYDGGSKAGSASNMEVVGHNNLGVRGFNGDVWQYKGYAYVGHWGFADWATGNSRFCPSPPDSGVAVIDARNPASRRASRRCRIRSERRPRTWSCSPSSRGRWPAATSPPQGSSGAAAAATMRTRFTG